MRVPRHCMVWAGLQSTPQWGLRFGRPCQLLDILMCVCVCHDTAWSGRICSPLPSGGLRLDRPCQLFHIMTCVPRHGQDGSAVHLPVGGLRFGRPCQLFKIMMCVPRHCMAWAGLQYTPQRGPAIWQTLSVVRLFDVMMCVPRHCMVWTGLQSTLQWGPVIWQTLSVVRYYDVCATTLCALGEGGGWSAVHSPVGACDLADLVICSIL